MHMYIMKKGNTAMFLSESEQMDESLSKGFNIYEVDENDNETLIATPEDGFLKERPSIEMFVPMNFGRYKE